MAYSTISKKSGKTYFLHARQQPLKNSTRTITLYYFSGIAGKDTIDALPDGKEVVENPKTGLPFVKNKK